MDWLNRLSFRLGTTSYILPDEILPNAHYLAGKVKDVELVLFEVDERHNNLPPPEVVRALWELTKLHDLTYTVHLPLDLRLGAEGDVRQLSILKAVRTIEATRLLEPQAYIVHLDGSEVRDSATAQRLQRWKEQASEALEKLAVASGELGLLAVENLENYPDGFWKKALQGLPASRCVDVGHLWLEGIDPLPYLEQTLEWTRVIHLHGRKERDHASLAHAPQESLDAVLKLLCERRFPGVVTMEVFGEQDLNSSLEAVKDSCRRIGAV
jgi:sugar phosphate isomerase/epimerase